MSGRKKKGRQPLVPFAGSERRRPGEADRLVDASHDLGPFDEEDGGGRGLDPELVALQAVGLKDYEGLAAYLRGSDPFYPELREFLAKQVRLESLSEYLRSGGADTPWLRGMLAEMCEIKEVSYRGQVHRPFIKSRDGPPRQRRAFYKDLLRAIQVAELMSLEGLNETDAFNRLAGDEDTSREKFRDSYRRFKDTEWIKEMTAPARPPTDEELEREEQVVGLTLDGRVVYKEKS